MWKPAREIVEARLREFLKKAPRKTESHIESQEAYAWLVNEGLSVGEGDMKKVFNSFRR